MTNIRERIESLVGNYCDGTFNGLEGARFVEYHTNPQDLADSLIDFVDAEIKKRDSEIERLRLLVAKHHELRPVEYGWGRKCQICEAEGEASNAQT
jgi:hypothetical protein